MRGLAGKLSSGLDNASQHSRRVRNAHQIERVEAHYEIDGICDGISILRFFKLLILKMDWLLR